MSHRKIKKVKIKKIQKQQQKKSHIPADWITGHRFHEIVSLLKEQPEFTHADRYLYGYALWRTRQPLASLLTLWPLAAKGNAPLQADCASMVAHLFKDGDFLSSAPLSEDVLTTLFMAARRLFPHSPASLIIKRRLFNTLWQQGSYEKLERILKSAREDEPLNILVENLSKLAFFQPENKFFGHLFSFVSHILTGGACLIVREPLYHGVIDDAIRALANELRQLFCRLAIQYPQKLTGDKSAFEHFVDYESGILIQVLSLAVKQGGLPFDIIPTPGYLLSFDAGHKRVGEQFLPWIAGENPALFEAYHADTHQAVLLALGANNLSGRGIKPGYRHPLNPFLRLALRLRTVGVKKSSLEPVRIHDFENTDQSVGLFKNVLIQTIQSMLDDAHHHKTKLTPEFWQTIQTFYPVLEGSELKNILIIKFIQDLKNNTGKEPVDFKEIRKTAKTFNDPGIEKQVDLLCNRQQVCYRFLSTLADKNQSKKKIRAIKDESALRERLTLIADCCFLVYPDLQGSFIRHVQSLVEDKKINQWIPLAAFFEYDFECFCRSCVRDLCQNRIPGVARALGLSMMSLPNADVYACAPSAQTLTPSVLSQPDPFKILGVSLTDKKPVIMQKMMSLMQQSPAQMTVFRQAQNELFNLAQRFLHHYFRYPADENSGVDGKASPPPSAMDLPSQDIPFRHELLHAN